MRVQNNDSKAMVVVTNWVSGGGKIPQQAVKATSTHEVTVDGVKTTVYCNTSKSGVPYFYVNLKNQWMWSRDQFVAGTYTTPVKAPKVDAKAIPTELQSTAAQEMGLEKKPVIKVIKKADK